MKQGKTNNISVPCITDDSELLTRKIKAISICDKVHMSLEDCRYLESLFHIDPYERFSNGLPSDIVFSKTMPLPNIIISLPVGEVAVVVFDDYIALENDDKTISNVFGAVIVNELCYVVISVTEGDPVIRWDAYGFNTDIKKDKRKSVDLMNDFLEVASDEGFEEVTNNMLGEVLEIWYMVQIAMLNPLTQDLFKHPAIETSKKEPRKKKKKRTVKYIRKHYITNRDIDDIKNNKTGVRKITCLAWYVCGHWRTYKNGRRIFIQPYWKGEMREARAKLDCLCREREIAQLSKEV